MRETVLEEAIKKCNIVRGRLIDLVEYEHGNCNTPENIINCIENFNLQHADNSNSTFINAIRFFNEVKEELKHALKKIDSYNEIIESFG